jgi:hypothetical protein
MIRFVDDVNPLDVVLFILISLLQLFRLFGDPQILDEAVVLRVLEIVLYIAMIIYYWDRCYWQSKLMCFSLLLMAVFL